MSEGETAEINMVVPIDLLPPILDDLLTRGQANVRAPRLGVFSADSDGTVVVRAGPRTVPPPGRAPSWRRDLRCRRWRSREPRGFYQKVWSTRPAGAEFPLRIVRDGRDTWLRVKSADRNSYLKRPQLQ